MARRLLLGRGALRTQGLQDRAPRRRPDATEKARRGRRPRRQPERPPAAPSGAAGRRPRDGARQARQLGGGAGRGHRPGHRSGTGRARARAASGEDTDGGGRGGGRPAPARPADEAFKLPAVQETMDALEGQDFLDRLWVKDATLWKGETAAIRNRLGWLTSPTIMRGHCRRHQNLRRRDPEAAVHARRSPRNGRRVAQRRCLQPDVRLQDGIPRSPAPRLDRSGGRQAHARPAQPDAHALHRRDEVRHDDRDAVALPFLPRTGRGLLGAARGRPLRGHHRSRPAARQARDRIGFPANLPQPGLDRRALLGTVLLRPRSRRAGRHRHQGAARPLARDGRGVRQRGRAPGKMPPSGSAPRWRGWARRDATR